MLFPVFITTPFPVPYTFIAPEYIMFLAMKGFVSSLWSVEL